MTSTRLLSAALLCVVLVACHSRGRGDRPLVDGAVPPTDGSATTDSGPLPDLGPAHDMGMLLPDLGGPPIDFGTDPRCGDFAVTSPEQCDSGGTDTSSCDSDCTFNTCGDRHVNFNTEECDDGPSGSSTCSTSCSSIAAAFCGDGVVNSGETCDDGGSFSGDGCSSTCHTETGWTCSGSPSFCSMTTTGGTPIHSGVNTITGSISSSDPTWDRVDTGCPASTYSGAVGVHYHTYTITNTTGVTLTLDVMATWSGFDGFLAVYTPPFTPTSPTSGCVAANDDSAGTAASDVMGVTIGPGASLVIVATTFSNTITPGSFTLTINAV